MGRTVVEARPSRADWDKQEGREQAIDSEKRNNKKEERSQGPKNI